MIDLKVFHDQYVISNSDNNIELKLSKEKFDREIVENIFSFAKDLYEVYSEVYTLDDSEGDELEGYDL